MRIAIAGSSGFLGTRLVRRLLTDGHEVRRLVRRAPRGQDEIRWDPAAGGLEPSVLSTVDVVVNLAGANVAGRRWNQEYRREIRDSRVRSTASLATALAFAEPRPATLLNSSAVGFYGDTGDSAVDETAEPGEGFLADVCRDWEAATEPAQRAGVRVVKLRTGLPLDRRGGLLKPLMLPFRFGVGGRLGSGRQYVPWISVVDWLGAVCFLLDRVDLAGPVNLTGPAPVTNAEFTAALAGTLHRPALLAVPGVALRVAMGGFGVEALASQRVLPGVLTGAGFQFVHPDVRSALAAALR